MTSSNLWRAVTPERMKIRHRFLDEKWSVFNALSIGIWYKHIWRYRFFVLLGLGPKRLFGLGIHKNDLKSKKLYFLSSTHRCGTFEGVAKISSQKKWNCPHPSTKARKYSEQPSNRQTKVWIVRTVRIVVIGDMFCWY